MSAEWNISFIPFTLMKDTKIKANLFLLGGEEDFKTCVFPRETRGDAGSFTDEVLLINERSELILPFHAQ